MHEPNNILALLGIPGEKVQSFDYYEDQNGQTELFLTLKDERPICPKCFCKKSNIHGYYKVRIKNSIIKAHHIIVEVDMRRYKCNSCGATFRESFPFYEPGKSHSRATDIAIIEDLKKAITYSYIAKDYDLSVTTVISIFDKLPYEHKKALSQAICVDEFKFSNIKHPKLKYPFVISNPFNGEILDIVESRTLPYLRLYFSKISVFERNNVKYFVSDMNENYRIIKNAFFQKAVHLIDYFHIYKMFSNAIMKVRISIMNLEEYKSQEYLFLKKNWKLFLMNRNKLKNIKKVNKRNGFVSDWLLDIEEVLRKYPDLREVYESREDFDFYMRSCKYWNEAKNKLDFFIQKFGHSQIKELNDIARTLGNWYFEIINTFAKATNNFNLSNATAEANNNNIQTLVDISYGLGDFERLRKRVLYINRNKTEV